MQTLRISLLGLAAAFALVACGSTSSGTDGGNTQTDGGSVKTDAGSADAGGGVCTPDAGTCNSCLGPGTDLGNQCAPGTSNCVHFDNSRVPATP